MVSEQSYSQDNHLSPVEHCVTSRSCMIFFSQTHTTSQQVCCSEKETAVVQTVNTGIDLLQHTLSSQGNDIVVKQFPDPIISEVFGWVQWNKCPYTSDMLKEKFKESSGGNFLNLFCLTIYYVSKLTLNHQGFWYGRRDIFVSGSTVFLCFRQRISLNTCQDLFWSPQYTLMISE